MFPQAETTQSPLWKKEGCQPKPCAGYTEYFKESWGETKSEWRDRKHFMNAGLLISHMRGWGAKTPKPIFRLQNDHFAKTGLGQTGEALRKRGRPFSAFFAGVHELLPEPSNVLYVTLLRHPVTRTTSGLNYNRVVKLNDGQTGGGEAIREITASGDFVRFIEAVGCDTPAKALPWCAA